MKIDAEYVRKIVAEIAADQTDPESAHALEDCLYVTVLQHIADGGEDAQELAALALEADKIDFPRWCA